MPCSLALLLCCVVLLVLAAVPSLALGEGSRPVPLPRKDIVQPVEDGAFDAAPFGEARTWQDGADIGILWEDPRDIVRVEVGFAGDPPDPAGVRLEYWVSAGWPRHRLPRGDVSDLTGWHDMGDWFKGEWKAADARLERDGALWSYTFNPANASEFPEVEDFDGRFRTATKLRLVFAGGDAGKVEALRAFTDSRWARTKAELEWGWGSPEELKDVRLEAFNGHLAAASSGVADIWYAVPAASISGDQSVITVRNGERSFSFDPGEIAEGHRIFVRELGALVRPAGDSTSYAQAEEAWREGPRTRYDMVSSLPEQTLERAWSDMPKKGRIYIPLSVEGGRQHFALNGNGDIRISQNWVQRIKGADTGKCRWQGENLLITFGFPQDGVSGGSLAEGCLPIPATWFEKDGIRFWQEAFAVPLSGRLPEDGRVRGDEPQVLMMKLRITNASRKAQTARWRLGSGDDSGTETLEESDGIVRARRADGEAVRAFFAKETAPRFNPAEQAIECSVPLQPGQAADVYLVIPFETPDEQALQQIALLDYARLREMISRYWRERLAQGTAIITPEPMLNDFYPAVLSHLLINTDNEIGNPDHAMPKVGTFHYGLFTNESVMMTTDLDRRGFHDLARRAYQTWIDYQGTAPLPGDYQSSEGVFYGAGGYEDGGYNQHHGWALWGMGEHYWFTRDGEWLDSAAGAIIKGCDWIIRERARTKTEEFTGIRAIEYGLLPPGSLEDIGDWRSWLSNNVFSWWGLDNAAKALSHRGHPEAGRLLKESAAYRDDIRRAFFEAMVRSPVQALRDGTHIPTIPSDVHRRGRSVGWITETLEGSIHLIRCGLISGDEPVAAWIMKDYEDNRYLRPPYGYRVPFEERDWFSLGGFSQQPSLLCSPTPYMMRDEPKHYIRAFFNSFAAGYFPERGMLTEHPLPALGDFAGDHFKSSDEAMSTSWIRWMFIWDEDDDLYLGMTLPRYWLEDGRKVSIDRAVTHFGPMSMSIESFARSGRIEMRIDPPTRAAPGAIYARFRHPGAMKMNRAEVNGKPWQDFDPEKEWVVLPPLTESTVVTAFYD